MEGISFVLRISCENAAFADSPGDEVARILEQVAQNIRNGVSEGWGEGFCRDINGNKVGEWRLGQ